MAVEIIIIVTERLTQSVTVIEHGGYTVKAESVKAEFIKPVFTVGEQVMEYLVLAVIKTKGTPCGMLMTVTGQEILIGITGQVTQTFILVLDRMRMHQIHYDRYAHAVSGINQFFQFLGGTET